MRTPTLLALFALLLASVPGPVNAQDNRPATHRGTGTEIADRYRLFHEDRARMESGAYRRMMNEAQQNMDAYARLRAQGRQLTPRR
jgi:hypothetical protein